mgnify:CR=1 FL=1
MIETIKARLEELKHIEQEKAKVNATLELELRDIDKKRNNIQAQINANLWANSNEKKEKDRLVVVVEELERLQNG